MAPSSYFKCLTRRACSWRKRPEIPCSQLVIFEADHQARLAVAAMVIWQLCLRRKWGAIWPVVVINSAAGGERVRKPASARGIFCSEKEGSSMCARCRVGVAIDTCHKPPTCRILCWRYAIMTSASSCTYQCGEIGDNRGGEKCLLHRENLFVCWRHAFAARPENESSAGGEAMAAWRAWHRP